VMCEVLSLVVVSGVAGAVPAWPVRGRRCL
jgi:hypothetical protein